MEALQRENRQLRAQLVEVQAKMSRLLASIQGLSDSVSKTLDNAAEKEGGDSEETGEPGNMMIEASNVPEEPDLPAIASMDLEPFDTSILDFDTPVAEHVPGELCNLPR